MPLLKGIEEALAEVARVLVGAPHVTGIVLLRFR
jgi:hypothetical protein